MWEWKYFSPTEVLSPDGLEAYKLGVYVIQPCFMDALEEFRREIGYPLLVNHNGHLHRGYRSPRENQAVGGERFSFHMQGLAADISCNELSIDKLLEKAKDFFWKGIGYYPKRGFIHVDLRDTVDGDRMTWTG